MFSIWKLLEFFPLHPPSPQTVLLFWGSAGLDEWLWRETGPCGGRQARVADVDVDVCAMSPYHRAGLRGSGRANFRASSRVTLV